MMPNDRLQQRPPGGWFLGIKCLTARLPVGSYPAGRGTDANRDQVAFRYNTFGGNDRREETQ
jgi:hypothetical protein